MDPITCISTGLLALEPPYLCQHRFAYPGATESTPAQVCWPWKHRTHTSKGLLALSPPYLYQHKFAGPRATASVPTQQCWPWNHRTHSITGLLALETQNPHQHRFGGPETMFSYNAANSHLSSLHEARSKGAGGRGEAFEYFV